MEELKILDREVGSDASLRCGVKVKLLILFLAVDASYCVWQLCYTDRKNFEDSYWLVKHFLDLTFW